MTDGKIDLVVGADGMIGGALLRHLRRGDRPVLGTSRRAASAGGTMHFLDLASPALTWNGPAVEVAYLCAAAAGLDTCRRDPSGTAQVNVEGTYRLARQLVDAGAFVVFLSTNQVFDGKRAFRRPEEATCPVTEYGRQKALAEERCLALGGSVAVLRLTKVIGAAVPLFLRWAASLCRGESIDAFVDMPFSPISIGSVVQVMSRLGKRRRAGVSHLSGDRDLCYAEAAEFLARILEVDETLVKRTETRAVNSIIDPPPRHTTLDLDNLPDELGFDVPDTMSVIRETCLASVNNYRDGVQQNRNAAYLPLGFEKLCSAS